MKTKNHKYIDNSQKLRATIANEVQIKHEKAK